MSVYLKSHVGWLRCAYDWLCYVCDWLSIGLVNWWRWCLLLDSIVLSWVLHARLLRIRLSHGNVSRHHWLIQGLLAGITIWCHQNSRSWLRSLIGKNLILLMVMLMELTKKSVASATSARLHNDCYQNENSHNGSHNHSNIVVASVIIVSVISSNIAVWTWAAIWLALWVGWTLLVCA